MSLHGRGSSDEYDGPSRSDEKMSAVRRRYDEYGTRGTSPYDEDPNSPEALREERLKEIMEEFNNSPYDMAEDIAWWQDRCEEHREKIKRLEAKIKELEAK